MNNEEARFLLQAYRPNGRDAQDPQFQEALEQVKRDPALEQWFREQQAGDAAVSEYMRAVPVPSTLKSSILAGRKTLRPAAWWSRRSMVTALAACFVALAGGVALLMTSGAPQDFSSYRADMVRLVSAVEAGEKPLRLSPADIAGIQDWIAANVDNLTVEVPVSLTAASGLGCSVVDWNGESVALACFRLGGGDVVHLLVINRSGVMEAPLPGSLQRVAAVQGMNTAAWSSQGQTYLLVSRAPADTLRELL
jgi:hypothetical protein